MEVLAGHSVPRLRRRTLLLFNSVHKLHTRMLRPMLACCKLYVSESRSAAALRAVEQAARRHHPAVVLVNRFADDAYNRVGYTLVADASSPLRRAVVGMVGAALDAIDLRSHAGAHPRLGAVDHVCFHPLDAAASSLRLVADLAAAAAAADIGDNLQVPTYLYGAAHREGRTLAAIRRQLGYFHSPRDGQWRGVPLSAELPVAPDAGPGTPSASKGVLVMGATGWVDNYNVPARTGDVEAVRRVARRVSERGGGLPSVQAMGLAHGNGAAEVACNLLDPGRVGAEEVKSMVERLAEEEGFAVGKGYFTDFSRHKIIEMYYSLHKARDQDQA